MKLTKLMIAAMSLVAAPASAAVEAVVVCGAQDGADRKVVHYTPIVKFTGPVIPKGSSHPTTVGMIDPNFQAVLRAQGMSIGNGFCTSADTVAEVQRVAKIWEQRSGYGVTSRPELSLSVLEAALDRMHNSNKILNGGSRSDYSVIAVGSMPK